MLRVTSRRNGFLDLVKFFGQPKFHRLNSVCHNPYSGNGQGIHQDRLSHVLPTSQTEDSDLALIVGIWGRLADEIKQRLIEMVRAKLPTRGEESEFLAYFIGIESVFAQTT